MSNGFRIKFGSQEFFTGCIVPTDYPTAFAEYPTADLYTQEQALEIINNPARIRARKTFSSIYNQGRRSSCNAYAAVEALAKKRAWVGLGYEHLAHEFIYPFINRGQDAGSLLVDSLRALGEIGAPLRDRVPYEAYRLNEITNEARTDALNRRAFEAYRLPNGSTDQLQTAILTALCRREPVVVAVHVGGRFTQLGAGGVCGFDGGPGNHAVHLDDLYFDGKSWLFDMPNSWGSNWGDRGRGFLTMRHFAEPSKYHAFYAIRAALSNPTAPNPKLE